MSLKKPSEYFRRESASVDNSIQDLGDVPELSSFSDAFDSFKNNLSRIEVFSSSLDNYNSNIEKVNSLSETVDEIKDEIQNLINKKDLDRAMMAQLLVVEQSIREVQTKVKSINDSKLSQVRSDISLLTNTVTDFVEAEVPKYKKLLEDTNRKYERLEGNVNKSIEESKSSYDKKYQKLTEKLQGINQESLSEIFADFKNLDKSFKRLREKEIPKYSKLALESERKTESKIDEFNEFFDETVKDLLEKVGKVEGDKVNLIKVVNDKIQEITSLRDLVIEDLELTENARNGLDKKVADLEVEIVRNESHLRVQNKNLEQIQEEVKSSIEQLNTLNEEYGEQNYELGKKVKYLEEVFEKFNEKEILTEGILAEPPTTNNGDPLTPTNKKFVTTDELQNHYRLFINRVQQQLATLGGGGETKLKYLDDIVGIATNASAYDQKVLTYDHAIQRFEFRNVPEPTVNLAEENIVYVAKDGDDANDGTLARPKLTIKAAVESVVAAGKSDNVIRVAPGTYIEDNPITLPDEMTVMGHSLRETTVIPLNDDKDLFYVGNGNYVAEMSYRGSMPGKAIFAFDPVDQRFIVQSPYIQNCTNFIPDSIGMRIDGKDAIGPLKSMVLDSYTQYNQGGIGVSITNEAYAQLVSLFTICSEIAVYAGSGGGCDLTNSNSSFGDYGLVADGVSGLKYTGILTTSTAEQADVFEVDLSTPTYNVVDADYNNVTGRIKVVTDAPHKFNVGMAVTLAGLGFTCDFEPGVRLYPSGANGYVFNVETVAPGRYLDAADRILANRNEILDKSLAAIALNHPNFIFPGDPADEQRYRYYDSYRLIQKNKQEIIDKALASIAVGFPSSFYFPDESETNSQSRFYDGSRLININKQEIIDKALASIAVGFPTSFYFPDEAETNSQSRFYDASGLITRNKQEIVDKSLASIAVGFPSSFYFPDEAETNSQSRFYDASRLITINKQEIVDKSLAAVAIAHSDFYFPDDTQTNIRSRFYDSYRLIQRNRDVIVGLAWTDLSVAYPEYTYTEEKCRRDLGFFVDAVSTDVFTGGNNYAREFVLQYFDGNGDPIQAGIGTTERAPSVYAFEQATSYMKSAITNTLVGAAYSDLTITPDPAIGSNTSPLSCANVQANLDNLTGIVTTSIGAGDTTSLPTTNLGYFDITGGQAAITGIGTTVSPGGLRCARDLSFLVEAVATDVFTGGNKYARDFTLQYFDAAGNPINDGLLNEEAESITAFNALKDYSKRALTNQLNRKNIGISSGPAEFGGLGGDIPVLPSGNAASCTDVQDAVDTLVGIVTTVIGAGSTAHLSTFSENLGISTTNKCARDIGFLVEAIATDVFTGGNKYARDFTLQYFDANGDAIGNGLLGEEVESVYAFNTVGEYAKKALTNQLNVKNVGISSGPAEYAGAGSSIAVLPSGNPDACTDVQDAVDTLVGIVTVVIGAGSTASLSTFDENLGISTTNKCARDLGFLVEAVATDVFTGGNKYAREFALQYFDNVGAAITNGLLGEEAESVYAFNSARDYAKKAVTNQLNLKNVGISAGPAEYGGVGGDIPVLPSGNAESCTDVQDAIDTLVGIVTTAVGLGTTDNLPSTINLGISTTNKCARDLGYVVDALSTDIFTGGNRYSRDYTKQYFNSSGDFLYLNGEEEQSVYAINTARDYAKKAITNQLNYKEVGISSGPAVYGGGGGDIPVLPSGNPESCTDVQDSIDTLAGIITSVIGPGDLTVLSGYPENVGTFTTVGSVCRRDIGYIVDAVTNDLIGYTNENIIDATEKYFTYSGVLDDSIETEIEETITSFNAARDYMKLAINNQLNSKDLTILAGIASIGQAGPVIPIEASGSPEACADVRHTIDTEISIITTNLDNGNLTALPSVSLASTIFTVDVGIATQPHYYSSGGEVKTNIIRPFDGQSIYFDDLYYEVKTLNIVDGGSGYTELPTITIEEPDTPWGVRAQAIATLENGVIVGVDMLSNGRGYRTAPKVTISAGINTAVATSVLSPEYYTIQKATEITNDISIITTNENVPYEVSAGAKVKFYKQSRILATGHSFEFIGAGTDIATCLPFSGGIPPKPENETDARDGGLVVYSSTNQAGNFKIGDGVIINQNTGSISGQSYSKSLLATVTPYILSLGGF